MLGLRPREDTIRWFFDISLWLKGIFAFSEIVAGVAAFFVSKDVLVTLTVWVTRDEFAEDPHDALAHYLLRTVENLSITSTTFAGIYLLAHGAVKLWLIVGLLRKRLWYYPVAIVVFALFIVYQLYRYTDTHSVWLLFLTLLDIVVILLTWHEWRYLRSHEAQ